MKAPIRFWKLCLASVLIAYASLSSAGILGDLNSMFMSNSSASSTINTKDRSGIFMGSYEMRAPIRSVNIVAFDPPRLSAGCGGIDMYGGSFSFINGQALIQVFRSVASNAAGLAFKAAIKSISPSLDGLISEFQSLMQNLNNMGKNSCHFAQLGVDALSKALDGEGAQGAVVSKAISDTAATWSSYLAKANDYLKTQAAVNPRSGNQLAKALVASGASGVMGVAGINNPDGSADDPSNPNDLNSRLIMSVMGFRVTGVPCTGTNAAGNTSTTVTAGDGSNPGKVDCNWPSTITLDQLIDGGGPGSARPDYTLYLYECLDPSGSVTGGFDSQICTQIKKSAFNYQGVRGWINKMLFGTGDASTGLAGVTSDSIIGEMNSGASFSFTSDQARFINQAGSSFIAVLGRVSDPQARFLFATRMAEDVISCVTAKLGSSLYASASAAFTDNTYVMSTEQQDHLKELHRDTLMYDRACKTATGTHAILSQINEATKLQSHPK